MEDRIPIGPEPRRPPSYSRFIFRAPTLPRSLLVVVVLSLLSAVLAWWPAGSSVHLAILWLAVFLGPAALAAVLTPPFARSLGGRIGIQRSVLLVATTSAVALTLLLVWRGLGAVFPIVLAGDSVAPFLLLLQGPTFWFRHMSLFGISRPSHVRSVGPSLLQPVLSIVGIFWLFG
ncbi:MAG: DUF2070 family protein, partial [Thermoplasmata archaeon]|nr:DUF2070 family protein [Thermoplasmata archaeon]